MKTKLFFLGLFILMLAANAEAKWVKCTMTYVNGTTKSGYIADFSDAMKKSVNFKTDLSAKAEKIDADELTRIEFNYDDGGKSILVRLFPARYNMSKKIKKDDKKVWFGILYEGGLNVMGISSQDPIRQGSLATTNVNVTYFNWPGEDYATEIMIKGTGTTFSVNSKSMMRKTCQEWFKGKCDKLVEKLNSGSFKPATIQEVVDFFEGNCEKVTR